MQYSLSNLCQSWVLPQMKQALLWAFGLAWPCPPWLSHPIHPLVDSFCQDWGTCPQALFFLSTYFSFNCHYALWSNCSHTRETSSQVMPVAHCHISSSPDYSNPPLTSTWEGEREGVRAYHLFQETKSQELWGTLLSKNFLSVEVPKKKATKGSQSLK